MRDRRDGRPRVAVIANTPLPYHTPILNRLADIVDLHVIYMSRQHPLGSSDPTTGAYLDQWGEEPRFPYSFHWSSAVRSLRSDFRVQFSFGASARLEALGPDAILFSSWGPLMLEPLAWRLLRRRRAVMWAESTEWSGLVRTGWSAAIRRAILHRVDAFVANGSGARDYLHELGVADADIVTSCLPSSMRAPASALPKEGPARRFLFVGRLIDRKRPLAAIEAFLRLRQEVPDASLTIVGDGPLWDAARAAAAPAGDSVRFTGRLEGDRLTPEYSSADVLLIPSVREVWGLVVNEALAFGLFVIATDQVASAGDLLDDSAGTIVRADDTAGLAMAMLQATIDVRGDPSVRLRRQARVRDCTPEAFAIAIGNAIGIALKEAG